MQRCIEEQIMDDLQDSLIAYEDENIVRHSNAVTWDEKKAQKFEINSDILFAFTCKCCSIWQLYSQFIFATKVDFFK